VLPAQHNASCATISTSSDILSSCVDNIKYLCIFIVHYHTFRCDLDHVKNRFTARLVEIFGKVGCLATEEVVVQLLVSKCIRVLMYGLEAWPYFLINSTFVLRLRFSIRLFRTSSILYWSCKTVSGLFRFWNPQCIVHEKTPT